MDQNSNCSILPDNYSSYDFSFKVILQGRRGVGKTCLAEKGVTGKWTSNHYCTIGCGLLHFKVKIKDKVIRLQIWDTAGQEIFRCLAPNYYKNAALAIIVYSIDDMESFKDINWWLQEVKRHLNPDAKIFLIGNKVDLEETRVVDIRLGQEFRDEYSLDMFFETSAKIGSSARQLFISAAQQLYDSYVESQKSLSISRQLLTFENQSDSQSEKCAKKKASCW